jgi:hypothetical protein
VIRWDNGSINEVTIVVIDIDLSSADPKSLAMNGFHDRHPQGTRFQETVPDVLYLTEKDAAAALELLLRDAEIIAAQPAFDLEAIGNLLQRQGADRTWHYRARCIESLAAGHLRKDPGGLQACAKALGVPVDPDVMHTSLGDARLVRACWERIFQPDQV